MGPLVEIVDLVVLVAMSLTLVVGVIFRPTGAGFWKRIAVSARNETAREVLGTEPDQGSHSDL